MADEYLTRTPTSTGNRKVFTISVWYKRSLDNTTVSNGQQTLIRSGDTLLRFDTNSNEDDKIRYYAEDTSNTNILNLITKSLYRDNSNWTHILANFNSTESTDVDRASIYVNGVKLTEFTTSTRPSIDELTEFFVTGTEVNLGRGVAGEYFKGQLSDYFVIDGQALTPDVFGFYKDGDGYVSAGSTQATDFRPGQWVPKKPSVIKNSVNNSGGFGVNGFYLPMNDSSNFGADFHCDPNTIITLQDETAAQPKNGAPTTSDSYVSQLRSDPYASNLVLAIPGITGGQGSGVGDYSADIKGSGSNKTATAVGNAGVAVTASYYGSAMQFDNDGTNGAGNTDVINISDSSDFHFTGDVTMECWINPSATPSTASCILGQWQSGGGTDRNFQVNFDTSNRVIAYFNSSATNYDTGTSSALALNQWHHVAAEKYGRRFTLYVNGVAVGVNTDTPTAGNNSTVPFTIGSETDGSNAADYGFNGYIQDVRVYKGVAKYKGGFDVSKPYRPVGISTFRQVPDNCKNNFATLNPLNCYGGTSSTATLTNGNLTQTTTDGNRGYRSSTIGITTGKWYAEVQLQSSNTQRIGVIADKSGMQETDNNVGFSRSEFSYLTTGAYGFNNALTTYGATYTNNDVIGIALNRTDGTITFFKNGVSQGIATDILNNGDYDDQYFHFISADSSLTASGTFSWNFGQNPTFSGNVSVSSTQRNADANGIGQFRYAPPTDHLALCEDNLPTPTIADPGKYFKTVLWTGDGNVGRSITGVGFKPDLVWIKSRSFANNHHLFDSVRGPNRILRSSTNEAETIPGNIMTSFDDDGFTVGEDGSNNATNDNGNTFVAWCWQAGAGTTSLNTDGAINSVVSVNQDAGFSIISYTGTGSNTTVGHGLTVTPNVVICKNRSNDSNWSVNGNVAGLVYGTNKLVLQSSLSIAGDTNEVMGAGTSILNLGTSSAVNDTNDDQIAYCWHEVEGFSKIGGYVGNGNNDGPFVYCGFKPAWVLIKKTNGSGAENWRLFDSSRSPYNQNNKHLLPSTNSAESEESGMDFVSNGFKLRHNDIHQNQDGTNYFFMAFAESPFQTANAK